LLAADKRIEIVDFDETRFGMLRVRGLGSVAIETLVLFFDATCWFESQLAQCL
jgi:hypothetical protein